MKPKLPTYEQALECCDTLTPLDFHYLALKCHGIQDTDIRHGRPSWNLFDDTHLYHITFRVHDEETPYITNGQSISLSGNDLPLGHLFVERVPTIDGRYYYLRHTDFLTPSLDDEYVLNINHLRQCTSCSFCQFPIYQHQSNVDPIMVLDTFLYREDVSNLSGISEIAVVTGCFGNDEKCIEALETIVRHAATHGFRGKLLYMGYEIISPTHVTRLLRCIEDADLAGLHLILTVECFEHRGTRMNGRKSEHSLSEVVRTLRNLKENGIASLEYAYIPGLDDYDTFTRGAELIGDVAKPHLCIFSPWRDGQRWQGACLDYRREGVLYLAKMRAFLEKLYEKPLLGNNLGNLWPFPRERVSKKWFESQLEGPPVGRRWWKGSIDLRTLDNQHIGNDSGK